MIDPTAVTINIDTQCEKACPRMRKGRDTFIRLPDIKQ
jgi:hypothetical protein